MKNVYSSRKIVDRIDYLLYRKKLKRLWLCEQCGIALNTLPNWSKNDSVKIPAQILYRIATLLGTTMEWLVSGENTNSSLPPQNIICLAEDINDLPEPHKSLMLDIIKTFKTDVYERESK